MEKEESVVKEFRHEGDEVVVRVTRREAADGRTWPNYRVGRYYINGKQERFTVDLRANDIPMAVWNLVQAYLWAKSNPQAFKNEADE